MACLIQNQSGRSWLITGATYRAPVIDRLNVPARVARLARSAPAWLGKIDKKTYVAGTFTSTNTTGIASAAIPDTTYRTGNGSAYHTSWYRRNVSYEWRTVTVRLHR